MTATYLNAVTKYFVVTLMMATIGILGCQKKPTPMAESNREASAAPPTASTDRPVPWSPQIPRIAAPTGAPLFSLIRPEDAGIDFVPQWSPRNPAESLLLKTGFTGGGVCLGDYDGDGMVDCFLTRPHGGARLYRNVGNFQFEDVTDRAGIRRDQDWPTGATFCDINNDGFLDLAVACLDSPNRLFVNRGDGVFADMTHESGFGFSGASIKTIFADYDNDGDLDAYVITNRLEPKTPTKIRYTGKKGNYNVAAEHQELAMVINLTSGEQKFAKAGQFDLLLRNDSSKGRVRFTDVSEEAGLSGNFHGLDGCWWDADGDGDSDLYITNDFTDPDQFFKNNGDGTFTESTKSSMPCTPWFAMGCASGDINNDGRLDLLVADMAGTSHYREKIAMGSMDAVAWFLDAAEPRQYMRNSLFVNTGTDRFTEAAHLAGLAKSDWTWSVKVADFDNDGLEDVFFTNGFTRDYLNSDFNNRLKASGRGKESLAWYDAPRLDEQNLAFQNRGGLHFEDASERWGLDLRGISFGAAVGDLDNDGDLDLIVNNFDAPPSIYRNGTHGRNSCQVQLKGSLSNRAGLGASITVKTEQGTHFRYHNPSGGFLSCDDSLVHVGLGQATHIESLTVRWPSGSLQIVEDIPTNQTISLSEPTTPRKRATASPTTLPLFTSTNLLGDIQHQETPFDDFADQPLLPNKLSQLGPGIALGDVNGDHLADIFVGGGTGFPGQLFLQTSQQTFEPFLSSVFDEHKECEDMGCILADFDGDGDRDLFVVSGGVEHDAGNAAYRDRLYVNESREGALNFAFADDAIPALTDSGGPSCAADFDHDGDLDLFIGARVVPGQYPTAPTSRLLRNDGGTFTAVEEFAAQSVGMVTGAIWSDYDNDGWADLILATDYGPIHVFRNEQGHFVDQSTQLQTTALLGWWNSITGCDVDADGDIDYVIGNLGRNTKYHPTEEKPQYLFYGNFQGGNTNHIVEAKSSKSGLLPTRGRSCSSNAMPFIADKFDTYHDFATASLQEIYSSSSLQEAQRVAATQVESGILINVQQPDGTRVFRFTPLPLEAQLSPVFGIEVLQLNNDRIPDLFLAQNFYSPQRETGRMAGGVGCVFIGNGDGTFASVSPSISGIVIPEDAKGTLSTDLNADGNIDLIVATNNGPIRTYTLDRERANQFRVGEQSSRSKSVSPKIELYLGSGYLSSGSSPWLPNKPQSTPSLTRPTATH